MPDRSAKALVLLERALDLDPTCALAPGFAAMCHHNRFLRGGLHEEHRKAFIRYAQAAIAYGQDYALALTFAGFSIGMDAHDRAAAFAALEAALAVSPSTALAYILGSVILGWTGEAKRGLVSGAGGLLNARSRNGRVSMSRTPRTPRDRTGSGASPAHPIRLPVQSNRATASHTCCRRRRSRRSGGSKNAGLPRHVFWNCSGRSVTVGNFRASIVRPR